MSDSPPVSRPVGVTILVGCITGWVASALGRGSGIARFVVGCVAFLNLLGGIALLFTISGHVIANGLSSVALSAVVLYILFFEHGSDEFFER